MLLLIESATSVCSVALASKGKVVAVRELNQTNCHAEKLTVFCEEVMKEAGISFAELDAVAVSHGPGSYTGLRIGMSAAKGICYALNKPLIAIGTLDAMAFGMREEATESDLLCPMIDARRMEVYCALYHRSGEKFRAVAPLVLDENSFADLLLEHRILFSGDGAEKTKLLLASKANAVFTASGMPSAIHLAALAEEKLNQKAFEDLAYCEPFYLKNFQPGPKRSEA
jgi:tRNA threonylcarbamoyladenosine biosynthesis protein TsaB